MKGIVWGVLINPLPIPRRFAEGNPHHITLFFRISQTQYQHLEGQQFTAIAETECWDDLIQAAKVTLPEGIPCGKITPHITISHVSTVSPSHSNTMLTQKHNARIWEPIPLTCQIKFQQLKPRLFDFIPNTIDPSSLRQATITDVNFWLQQGCISGVSNPTTAEKFSRVLNIDVPPQAPFIPVDTKTDFIVGLPPFSTPESDNIRWFIYEAP